MKPPLSEEVLLLVLLLQGRVLFLKTFLRQDEALITTPLLREDCFLRALLQVERLPKACLLVGIPLSVEEGAAPSSAINAEAF